MSLNKILKLSVNSRQDNLALKISAYVFYLLTLSFALLITIYHFQTIMEEENNFVTEVVLLRQSADFPNNIIKRSFDSLWKQADKINVNELHDFLIIPDSWETYYNWVFEVIERNEVIKKVWNKIVYMRFGANTYMMIHLRVADKNIYIAKDTTHRVEWEKKIIYTSLVLDVVLMILIYLLSKRLSLLAIEPIQKANKKLKDYNHNLAHELKTPISIIRSDLELSKLSWEMLDYNRTIEELKHIEDIVNSLLTLSEIWWKAEEKQDLSVWDIVKRNVAKLKKAYKISNEKIEINIQKDFMVNANEKLLDILIKNIIENSIKYSLDNTAITINISLRSLIVSNIWKLISQDEIDNLFQPFYKGSNSVNWYWLWLNIVKTIADRNSWKITFGAKKNIYTLEVKF
ncbi:MAG: Sensor protein [uncultured bacterium (gcode 4)]|uniref:histidine kinase n=1 Tax=uncultured bacterium (gcode 4) TaxID=1234023 RepID=K2FAV1_9BACT|nr:MAG: Sensor protein [uncultured bacterium (gcode 4)]